MRSSRSRLSAVVGAHVRPATALVAATTLVVGISASISLAAPAGATTPGPLGYTPGEATVLPGDDNSTCYSEYVVPPGVTQLGVQVIGDSGVDGNNNFVNGTGTPGRDSDGVLAGNAGNGQPGGLGGFGSEVNTIINVTPGQTLYVGAASDAFPGGAGGAAGMGLGRLPDTGAGLRAVPGTGGSGGNASFISLSVPGANCTFTAAQLANDVLVVAAGGGGGGGAGSGQDAVHANGILAHDAGGDGGSETGSGQVAQDGESLPWDVVLSEAQLPGQELTQRDAGKAGTNASGSAGGVLGGGGYSLSMIGDWKKHDLYGGTEFAALSCIPGQGGGAGQSSGGGSGGSAAQALSARDADVQDVISSSATVNIVSKISQSLRSNVTKISRMSAGLPKEGFFESEGGIMLMMQLFYALFDHIMSVLTGDTPTPSIFLTGCGGLITDPDPGYYGPEFLAGLTTGGGGGGGGGIYGGGGGGGADDFYLGGGGGGGGAGASYVKGQSYTQTRSQVAHATTTARVRLVPIRTAPTVAVPNTSVICVVHSACSLPVTVGGYPVGQLGYRTASANLPAGIRLVQDTIHHSATGHEPAYDAFSPSAAIGGTAQYCFDTGVHTYTNAFAAFNSEGSTTLPPVTVDVRPGTLGSTSIAASYGDDLSNLYAGGNPVHVNATAYYSSTCDFDVTRRATGTWSVSDEQNRVGDPVPTGSVLTVAPLSNGQDEGLLPIGPGSAVVHFSYTDEWGQTKQTQTTVTVAHGAPLSIAFDDASATLEPGGHLTPTVRADYGLGDIEDVTQQIHYSGVPSALNQAGLSIQGSTLLSGTPLQVGPPTATASVTANLGATSATLPVTIDFSHPVSLSLQGNPAAQTVLEPGRADAAITATAHYAAGGHADVSHLATWSSNHPSIADVDADGTVAVPYYTVGGTVTATATLGSASGDWLLNVALGAPDSIAVDDGNGHTGASSIPLGYSLQLHATGTVAGDSVDITPDSTWTSSAPSVATVTSGGVLHVVGPGSATITAARRGVQGTMRVTTDLSQPSRISVTPTGITIPLGGTQRFHATGTYAGGLTADISNLVAWTAPSNLGSFAANSNLFSTDVSHASTVTASVTATLGSATDSATVTKLGASPTSVTVSGPSPDLRLGESQQLTVTAHFFDGSTADVTSQVSWSTQDAGLFTVSASGVVTAIAGSVDGIGSDTNIWARYDYTDTDGSEQYYTAADFLTVDLRQPGSIAIEPITDFALANGTSHNLMATGTYANGYTADISGLVAWHSSNTTDTTITGSYQRRLNILTPGSKTTTTLTADYGGKTASVDLDLPGAFKTISGPSTGDATVGSPLSLDFSIAGGAAPYAWSVPSSTREGSDLRFSSAHGASTTLTFNPVGADWSANGGAYHLLVLVTDALGHQSSQGVTVTLARRSQTLSWVQDLADTAQSTDIWYVSADSSAGLQATITIPSGVPNNGCKYEGGAIKFNTGQGGTCTFDAVQAGNGTYASASLRKTVSIVASSQLALYAPGTSFPGSNSVGASDGIVSVTKAAGDPATIAFSTDGTTNNACSLTVASSSATGTSVYVHWAHPGTCMVSASIPAASNATTGYSYPAASVSPLTTMVMPWTSFISWYGRYSNPSTGVRADANLKVGGTYQPLYSSNFLVSDFILQSPGHAANLSTVTVAVAPGQSSPADACTVDTTKSSGIVTGQLKLAHTGTCAVIATQAAAGSYDAGTSTVRLFTIGPASQTITNFHNTSPGTALIPGNKVSVAATVASGLPVTYSVDPATTNGACSVEDDTVTLVNAGKCVVAADQAGNDDYTPAARVKLTLTVAPLHLLLRSATTCTPLQQRRGLCARATVPPLSGPITPSPSIPVRVVLMDASNNPVNAPSDITVALDSDGAGDGSSPVFQDLLHNDIASTVIVQGTSATTVLYGDGVLGPRDLHASGQPADPDSAGFTAAATPLTVMAAPAATIAWSGAPPADGSVDGPLPTFGVAAYDDLGDVTLGDTVSLTATNVDTGDAVALSSGGSARITDDPDTGGRAVFDSVVLSAPGSYTLTATTEDVSITSDPFTVSAGLPARATFSGVPETAVAGTYLAGPVKVAVTDAGGNPVSEGLPVDLDDGGAGGLNFDRSYTDSDGVATFDNVWFDNEGVYALNAVFDGSALDGTSDPITVTAAPRAPEAYALPGLSGDTVADPTLTGTDGGWDHDPTGFSYQWLRCDAAGDGCTPIDGATGPAYTPTGEDVGSRLRFRVTATNDNGSTDAVSDPSAVIGRLIRLTAPVVTGDVHPGDTLAVSTGTWAGSPTGFAYQWQRCSSAVTGCAPIPGADQASHVITGDDAGHRLRVRVVATNAVGSVTAWSKATPGVGGPEVVTAPVVTGGLGVGDTQTTTDGTWTGSPTGYAYQWQRCTAAATECATIPDADQPTYVITDDDAGHRLRARVVASNDAGSAGSWSRATRVVGYPKVVTAPVVTGGLGVGDTVTTTDGDWTGNPTGYAYQWQRCTPAGAAVTTCTAIAGADQSTYLITDDDAGHRLRVRVVASNGVGSTNAWSRATRGVGGPEVVTAPVVTGGLGVGDTLVVSTGTWTGSPTGYAYQWQRCTPAGAAVTTCTAIAGADQSTYLITDDDAGHRVRVRVVASNDFGSANAWSRATHDLGGP